jgi:alpha-1,6-mannosyltransferase
MFRNVPALLMLGVLLSCHAARSQGRIDLLILAQLTISSLYLVLLYVLGKKDQAAPAGEPAASWRWILTVALLLRVAAFTLPPAFSEDLYRYRWDGQVQVAGGNPYIAAPDHPQWGFLNDETAPKVGSRDVPAGYGPFLLLIERFGYLAVSGIEGAERQVFWSKVAYVLPELGLLAATYPLLGPSRWAWYALAPLPVTEIWWNGHNDGFPTLFVILALLAVRKGRIGVAFLALGLSISAKWWPVWLIPVFLVEAGRILHSRGKSWGVLAPRLGGALLLAGAPTLFLLLPFLADAAELLWNVRHTSGFVGGWRNNDSLFGGLLWLAGSEAIAKRLAFGIIGAVAGAVAWTHWRLEGKVLAVLTTLLLVSSNCHPWYLLWFWPLIGLYPFVPYLLWAALMPLAYGVLVEWEILRVWVGSRPERWMIYGPVFISAALLAIFNTKIRFSLQSVSHSADKET